MNYVRAMMPMHARYLTGQRLSLVIDINKTILMTDPASGQTQEDACNSILAGLAWGNIVPKEDALNSWEWDGNDIRKYDELEERGLINYSDFIHSYFMDGYDLQKNKKMKKYRKEIKCVFTNPDMPGQNLRHRYTEMLNALELPSSIRHHADAEFCGLAGKMYYFIVPAYFDLLTCLVKCGINFNVQLSSFGYDIPLIIEEHNAFCEGRHPLSEIKLDGTDPVFSHYDLRIRENDSESCAAIFRDDSGIALIPGTLDMPCSRSVLPGDAVTSLQDIANYFKHNKRRCTAVRQCYQYWRDNLEISNAGKLVFISGNADCTDNDFVLVFDDCISYDNLSVIDFRDSNTGLPIKPDAVNDHAVRAESFWIATSGMKQENYFIKEISRRWKVGPLLLEILSRLE